MIRFGIIAAVLLGAAVPAAGQAAENTPIIIAHRGASAERPEHTLAAYELAIDQGADYIEPDLVVTKDLQLVARHENELSGTTDVASRPEFEDRRRTKTVEGREVAGWFSEDFTLAELRTLRARERVPSVRPASARFDGLYQIATFEEIVKLVRAKEAATGRTIGIYPELKHPTLMLQQERIDMVDLMVRELRRLDLDREDARVFIQIFEVTPLQRLKRQVKVPLILLIGPEGGPFDEPRLRWADMMTPSGLAEVAKYADGIGPYLGHVLDPATMQPTALVRDAHAAGLKVHPWTLRKENGFLPAALQSAGGPADAGNYQALFRAALASGADGLFTDNVKEMVAIRAEAQGR